ncbi:MAG TPA: glycogen/starch/alpha-glucan phosphorylase [Parachlamydiaceae bacterium]|nr:glycogen/starch/alpha-glucan phosphorylase [Parachlamydiaceae bacterium]
MDLDLDYQAEMLAAKIKHYLITTMGRTSEEANTQEFYKALSYALREEIMINWLSCNKTYEKNDNRMVYYLSMEYLPGRLICSNIANLDSTEVVKLVLQKLNRNYHDILSREPDPGLGNGGLGRLASCYLDSLATQHYPAQGYGLRYQYGIFEQQLWDGLQIEAPDPWLMNENPWEFRRDLRKVSVKYGGQTTQSSNIHGDEILFLKDYEEVSALPYDLPIIGFSKEHRFSVVTLRLWSTKESPRNFQLQRYNAGKLDQAAENMTLTDVLYPSDHHEIGKRIRLKQEYLLVSASIQDIIRHYLSKHDNFRAFADKVRIQINDTHPSLIIAELIRLLTAKYDLPWKMAVEITQNITGYTNHTVLAEALERWEQGLMYYLLPRQYKIIERLNFEFCNSVRAKYPNDEEKIRRMSIIQDGDVRMAPLSVVGSHKVNGVSKIHTNILKDHVFKDFNEFYPDKFINITNGVTQRRWILEANPELGKLITKRIGDGWITDFAKIKDFAKFADDPQTQEEFISIKQRNKHRLIEFLAQENKPRDSRGYIYGSSPILDVTSLFDVQIKRIHEYKRQLLNILHAIMLYQEILENPVSHGKIKRTCIFAGKAAAGYETAKEIIELIYSVGRKINKDERVGNHLKVIYIENYNISRAEIIIPAAELSEQISTAGTEASGTGNMKLAINGALTIGTEDGANIEMCQEIGDAWWPFSFGCKAEEIAKMKNDQSYHPASIVNENPKIRKVLDTLIDHTFATNEKEHTAFINIYKLLLEGKNGEFADPYFVLKDFDSYSEAQRKVEVLYQNPAKWAEYTIHNIAGMGKFSGDYAIKQYCDEVWGIKSTPIDEGIYRSVENEFKEIDRCRIYIGK